MRGASQSRPDAAGVDAGRPPSLRTAVPDEFADTATEPTDFTSKSSVLSPLCLRPRGTHAALLVRLEVVSPHDERVLRERGKVSDTQLQTGCVLRGIALPSSYSTSRNGGVLLRPFLRFPPRTVMLQPSWMMERRPMREFLMVDFWMLHPSPIMTPSMLQSTSLDGGRKRLCV